MAEINEPRKAARRKKDPERNIEPTMIKDPVGKIPDFGVYPNQNIVRVKRCKPRAPFCAMEDRYMYEAMRRLDGTGFKLYCYLCDNNNDFMFGLSKKAVVRNTGIGDGSYKKAKKELVENGYLVPMGEVYACKDCRVYGTSNCTKECRLIHTMGYVFTPRPKDSIADLREYFGKADETYAKGFAYADGDYWDDPKQGDDAWGFFHSDKFNYNDDAYQAERSR